MKSENSKVSPMEISVRKAMSDHCFFGEVKLHGFKTGNPTVFRVP